MAHPYGNPPPHDVNDAAYDPHGYTDTQFKKPFSTKTSTAIRSSDRRKLRTDVLSRFAPRITEEQLTGAGWAHSDELVSEKIETHAGEIVTVFRIRGQPWWFRDLDGGLFPSVYACWALPDCCFVLSTHGYVMGKILGGADLMLPGVIVPTGGLPPFATNDPVAVNVVHPRSSNPLSPPLCVGVALIPAQDATEKGMRGRGVKFHHWMGDALWASGDKSKPAMVESVAATPEEEGVENAPVDTGVAAEEFEQMGHAGFVAETHGAGDKGQEAAAMAALSLEDSAVDDTAADDVPSKHEDSTSDAHVITPAEMDSLLYSALLQALKVTLLPLLEDKQKERELLPLSGSTLYCAYIQQWSPEGFEVDVKRTTYKKLSKFLKAVEKKGILKTKEVRGETLVTGINKQHPEILIFKPFKQWKAQHASAASSSSNSTNPSAGGPTNPPSAPPSATGPSHIAISEFYKPYLGGTREVFGEMGRDLTALYSPSDVREILQAYVKEKDLAVLNDPRRVKLDMNLVQVVKKDEQSATDTLPRDELTKRFIEKMHSFYELSVPGQEPVVRKGRPSAITITVERRSGNKTVTRVSGLEPFGIDAQKAAEDLRVKCGTGTTVQASATSTPAKPSSELLIQGSKAKEVEAYLEDRWKVPFVGGSGQRASKLVEVVDKASKT